MRICRVFNLNRYLELAATAAPRRTRSHASEHRRALRPTQTLSLSVPFSGIPRFRSRRDRTATSPWRRTRWRRLADAACGPADTMGTTGSERPAGCSHGPCGTFTLRSPTGPSPRWSVPSDVDRRVPETEAPVQSPIRTGAGSMPRSVSDEGVGTSPPTR